MKDLRCYTDVMKMFRFINLSFVIYNSLFWLFIISVNFSTSYGDSLVGQHPFDVIHSLTVLLLSYGPWMLFTPFLYELVNRAVVGERRYALINTYLGLFVSWLPLYIALDTLVMLSNRGLTDKSLLEGILMYPKFYAFFNAVIYSGMFGGYLAIIYFRHSRKKELEALTLSNHNTQLELRLSELKMQALQAQLEPHFLFNALNSISSLVRIADKKQALKAIRQLSDLLRFAVAASPRKLVNFKEELQFTRDYIDLQRLRFGQRLDALIDDQCDDGEIQCPPYIVQTLVENAIVHNLEKSGEALTVTVTASYEGQWLNIVVENSAVSDIENVQGTHSGSGLGVGLENLRNRLNILYQHNFSLTLEDQNGVYRVLLRLPV